MNQENSSPPHIVDSGASVMGLDNERSLAGEITEGFKALERIRQLEAELTEAGGMIGVMREYISDLEKGLDSSINLNKAQAERQVKELTDGEIRHIQAICHLKDVGYDNFIMRFARAILRKAQEK